MTSITALQEQVAKRLAAELENFTGRTGWDILTEVKGDIENLMTKRLQSLGLGLCVFTPLLGVGDFPDRRDAEVTVSIVETNLINMSETGMRVPGIDVAWLVDGILHEWAPDNGWTPLQYQRTETVASPFPGTNSWDVTFRTSAIVQVVEQTFDETRLEQEPLAS